MGTTINNIGWLSIPTTYIYTTLDRCIPLKLQKDMVRSVREVNPKAFSDPIGEFTLETGHSPFLSNVNGLGDILVEIAAKA